MGKQMPLIWRLMTSQTRRFSNWQNLWEA